MGGRVGTRTPPCRRVRPTLATRLTNERNSSMTSSVPTSTSTAGNCGRAPGEATNTTRLVRPRRGAALAMAAGAADAARCGMAAWLRSARGVRPWLKAVTTSMISLTHRLSTSQHVASKSSTRYQRTSRKGDRRRRVGDRGRRVGDRGRGWGSAGDRRGDHWCVGAAGRARRSAASRVASRARRIGRAAEPPPCRLSHTHTHSPRTRGRGAAAWRRGTRA